MKVYLINGESYLLINEKINEIVKSSKNVSVFDFNACLIEDIVIEASYVSMFQEMKYLIVKNANFFGSGKLKDADNEILLKILQNDNPNVTVIFVCYEKIDSRKKITKLVSDKITIPILKFYEIEKIVQNKFSKNGFKIDSDTVKFIVQNGLNNYDIIMNEVDKIMLFYDEEANIKYQDVEKLLAKNLNSNNFLFVDAVVDNDLEKSLAFYNDLKTLKVEPTVLITLLARDFRIMLQMKELLLQGKREYEIMNSLGLVDWQLDKYLKKVFPYKKTELENIILKLSQLDFKIKSGNIDKNIGLELFILDICE